jgi:hypothetical protein
LEGLQDLLPKRMLTFFGFPVTLNVPFISRFLGNVFCNFLKNSLACYDHSLKLNEIFLNFYRQTPEEIGILEFQEWAGAILDATLDILDSSQGYYFF